MRGASVAALALALACASCRGREAPERRESVHASACAAANGVDDACVKTLEVLLAEAAPQALRVRVERRVLARAAAEALVLEARALGAPSESEREAAATALWPRWNDGAVVDVVHALFATTPDADRRARAFTAELPSSASEEDFRALAKTAGAGAIERINGVGNRGRTLAGLELVREFSDAAVRLTLESPRSDLIHTAYGSHVLLLLSRHEPEPFVVAERDAAVLEEAMNRRVRARIQALREKTPSEPALGLLQSLEIPSASP
jgi:hypothetical protein